MDHTEVGRYWDENAAVWTRLARAGYDVYRDYLNTPAFFEMLPDVQGLLGLDIGCGEGHNTRLLAERGARVTALDISQVFVQQAKEMALSPPGISYQLASAVDLPYAGAAFDFATGFMSFMDIAETDRVIAEAYRVLKPGGFLQFSITHPCYDTAHRRNLRDDKGLTYAIEVGGYFENLDGDVEEWLFDPGFVLERIEEPRPSDQVVRECPRIQDTQVVAYFLYIRARKPGTGTGPAREGS